MGLFKKKTAQKLEAPPFAMPDFTMPNLDMKPVELEKISEKIEPKIPEPPFEFQATEKIQTKAEERAIEQETKKKVLNDVPDKLPKLKSQLLESIEQHQKEELSFFHKHSFGPIYVKVDNFRNILEYIDISKAKLAECFSFLKMLNDLKQENDKSLADFHKILEDMEKKLLFLDKKIYRGA